MIVKIMAYWYVFFFFVVFVLVFAMLSKTFKDSNNWQYYFVKMG